MTQQLVPKYKFKVFVHVLLITFKRSNYHLLVQTFTHPNNLCFHGFGFFGFLLSLTHFPEVHSVYNVTQLNTFRHLFCAQKMVLGWLELFHRQFWLLVQNFVTRFAEPLCFWLDWKFKDRKELENSFPLRRDFDIRFHLKIRTRKTPYLDTFYTVSHSTQEWQNVFFICKN